ncbi:hypothetical protein CLIB1423_03S01904 [[Candida] railenensis]|uniref:Endonuclease/exonuclease/phosphatase domain-containing protein n=1 Tax=[Candida] railenensis TaxID=45579 RepID=A0A9P0VX75_9ASCO|nr:hypothetical protein CLIB1423_03S01904 [[Candida] railenensis]
MDELFNVTNPFIGSSQTEPFHFRIVSHNVRVDTMRRFPHEKPWSERKVGVIDTLKSISSSDVPVLFGLQEVKYHQLNDVLMGLNDGNSDEEIPWTHYGVGRDDGNVKGEFAPIIYNSDEWRLLNGTSRWLSSRPHHAERSWGAATKRVVTIATFQNKASGNVINFINTHLDHKSERAKRKSSKLLLDWIDQIPNEEPTFLSGDFNSLSNEIAYELLATKLDDANSIARNHKYYKDTKETYTGFEKHQAPTIIDFIWSTLGNCKTSKIEVDTYSTLSNEEGKLRFSDHRPLQVDYKITDGGTF